MGAASDYLSVGLERNDKERIGLAGYELLAIVDESVERTADVPDIFLEDGSVVQTSIIKNPLVVTITGEVGDIHVGRTALDSAYTRLSNNVGLITQYTPLSSAATTQRISKLFDKVSNKLRKVDQVIKDGKQISTILGNQDAGQNNREKFLDHFDRLYESNQLVSVESSFRRHDSMAITSFTTSVNNKTNAIAFKIILKKFQIASAAYVKAPKQFKKPSLATSGQVSAETDQGVQAGEKVQRSIIGLGIDFFGGK